MKENILNIIYVTIGIVLLVLSVWMIGPIKNHRINRPAADVSVSSESLR
jgi:hypothetical protein